MTSSAIAPPERESATGTEVDQAESSVLDAVESGTPEPEEPGFWAMSGLELISFAVACVGSLFVFGLLNWPRPDGGSDLLEPLLFLDTTPSGGDMGAHVWGPAYLRDHLLPQGRLTGWTPDWYAGFPAFHFYMVVPALVIVAINAGLPWFLGFPLAGAVLYGALNLSRRMPQRRGWIFFAAVAVAALVVSLPYGVAFKLVSVSGLVFFPLSAWAMGRLAGAREPIPGLLSLAALIFLFDTNFSIYGGNIASTLAGEFAFSISLCLSLLAIGMTFRGMDDHRWRAPAAVVIALVALCHIIPVFFMVPALILIGLSHKGVPIAWAAAATVAFGVVPIAFADGTGLGVRALAVVAVLVVLVSAIVAEPIVLARSLWLTLTGLTAVLITGFWLLPFYLREPFFNDMGWERLNEVGPPLLTVPMKIALPVAAIGLVTAYAARERIAIVFAGTGVLFLSAVANLGEGPLWNARLLPFYYLSVYILAAVGLGLMARFVGSMLSQELDRPDRRVVVGSSALALAATLIAISMPLRILPGGGVSADGGDYEWLVFSNRAASFIPSWAEWNYSGYERKDSYAEYSNVVRMMDEVGSSDLGCGRAMWEYDQDLDRYGTPMALMLLPHWTDGCIGSMEGLYFESSSTTPFHFLNQSTLSEAPSRAQRDLPYLGFDIDRGISQLQVMGVRYYLAQSDAAIGAAREHPDLTEVAEAQPFVVFAVDDADLVQGLEFEPVVATGRTEEQVLIDLDDAQDTEVSRFDIGWVGEAVRHYNDPGGFSAIPAEDGPSEWQRVETLLPTDGVPIDPVSVSDIEVDEDRISFQVDQVGSPVLVKASFFPNWNVDGADGPWRAGPNLMIVTPTEDNVTLSYGRTPVDMAGIGLTVIGLLAVAALVRFDRRGVPLVGLLGRREDGPKGADPDFWTDDETKLLDGDLGSGLDGGPDLEPTPTPVVGSAVEEEPVRTAADTRLDPDLAARYRAGFDAELVDTDADTDGVGRPSLTPLVPLTDPEAGSAEGTVEAGSNGDAKDDRGGSSGGTGGAADRWLADGSAGEGIDRAPPDSGA